MPHDFDKAVETLQHYDKYVDDVKEYNHVDGIPIYTYYALNKVFNYKHKPLKIHFQLLGVFESKKKN